MRIKRNENKIKIRMCNIFCMNLNFLKLYLGMRTINQLPNFINKKLYMTLKWGNLRGTDPTHRVQSINSVFEFWDQKQVAKWLIGIWYRDFGQKNRAK